LPGHVAGVLGGGARPPEEGAGHVRSLSVKQKLSEAIDTVRRQEAKARKELLKNTRYLWLKRPDNLTVKQLDWLDVLLLQPLDTVRAYELALKFDDFYELTDAAEAEEYLRRWVTEARGSELEPLAAFADTLEAHWAGVLRWHTTRVSNGLLEGLNSLIQTAKRRARGYRSVRNYKTMIYLVVGKLKAGPQSRLGAWGGNDSTPILDSVSSGGRWARPGFLRQASAGNY